jgi:hypothetical protein
MKWKYIPFYNYMHPNENRQPYALTISSNENFLLNHAGAYPNIPKRVP